MKKTILRIVCFMLVFTMSVPFMVFASVKFREASVVQFSGTVKVIIDGGQKEYNAYKGMSLGQGDTLITSKDAWVTFYVDDDKEIKLGEKSRLTLSELSKYVDSKSESTGLRLWAGKVWVKVKKKLNVRSKFEITTGSTVMGVKGTKYYVACEPVEGSSADIDNSIQYRTELAVLEGVVATTVTIPQEDASGKISHKRIRIDVKAYQRIIIDETIKSKEDIEVKKLTPEMLDLLVLEDMAENPNDYSESFRRNLEALMQQRQEERRDRNEQQEEREKEEAKQDVQLDYYYKEEEQVITPGAPPANPTVCMNTIPNMTITKGSSGSRAIIMNPIDGQLTVSVTDSNIASLNNTGNIVYVTGIDTGTVTVTITASKSGYTSVSKQFTVTVEPIGSDTVPPQLLSGSLPHSLKPFGDPGDKTYFDFSEEIYGPFRINVENAIKDAVQTGDPNNLIFTWDHNTLKVSNSYVDEIIFNYISDITATVGDISANSQEVILLDLGTIVVDNINNMTLIVGMFETDNRTIVANPSDVNISASYDNTYINVTTSGNVITVTKTAVPGVLPHTISITLLISKEGYESIERSFDVTITN